MKLLLDQNLSLKLVGRLRDLFPGSLHVSNVGLGESSDKEVWEYARVGDFVLVTKDADFSELSILFGAPPKVIWLQVGNCPTDRIESLLRARFADIASFAASPTFRVLRLK